ncbi:hypothetical protein Gpo141_00004632 [Globisporangium polare]
MSPSSSESDSDAGSAHPSSSSESVCTRSESSVKREGVNELSLDFLLNEQPDVELEEATAAVDHDVVEREEPTRKRQRRYEMAYRQRKATQLRRLRREWLQLEGSLRALRAQSNRSFVSTNRPERGASFRKERLLMLLEEEQSLQRDIVALNVLEAWRRLAKARRQEDDDDAWTVKDWVKVSASVLEPSVLQYYTAKPRFTFSW